MYVYLKNCISPIRPKLKRQENYKTQIAASLLFCFPIMSHCVDPVTLALLKLPQLLSLSSLFIRQGF